MTPSRSLSRWLLLPLIVVLGIPFPNTATIASPPFDTLALSCASADVTQCVNPFLGTSNGGFTFPGADVPFGMVQWSPDTSSLGGGYDYNDSRVKGFGLTHLSGVGCRIYEDIPFMPVPGAITESPASNSSLYDATFSHANESASPGYYGVQLDSGVKVDLTTTTRTGFGLFTYPATATVSMLINTGGSAPGDSAASVQIVGNNEVTGSASNDSLCSPYTVFFAARFDRTFSSFGVWNGATISQGSTGSSGPQSGAYVSFDTALTQTVRVKVGISFVSVENAAANLDSESPGWDFNTARDGANAAWSAALNRIQVQGGAPVDTETFYTALYHTLMHPNVFSDANGQYMGFDNQVHTADYTDALGATHPYTQFANFSGWDVYRSEVPLLAMLAPMETSDMMQSLVAASQQIGWLPKWSAANSSANIMVGDSADPIIAGAYAFGATRFDSTTALQAMLKGATQPGVSPSGYVERPGLTDYLQYGYIPTNASDLIQGPTATTLEYAIDDFAIAQFARALGDTTTFNTFTRRSQNWQNVFNAATGYVQPRGMNGEFPPNLDLQSWYSYAEGTLPQYTWMVPQNLQGLFNAMGGNQQVVGRLDAFLSQLNGGPNSIYAWMGNEVCLEVPWEYDFAGAPWRTQAVVRQVMTQLYAPAPDGLPGNDDLGELSSWYVFAALGFYPEIPGVGDLVLGSPLFPHATLHLASGDVTIDAPGATDATPYIQSLTVNGRPYSRPWLSFQTLESGASLQFVLGSAANTIWGSDPSSAPPSFSTAEAPALGFTSPGISSLITVTAGSSQSFQIAVQDTTDLPVGVQWNASTPFSVQANTTVPAGFQVDPPSGAISVDSPTPAHQTLTLLVDANVPAGRYYIPFNLQTIASTQGGNPGGVVLPQVVMEVFVNPAPPAATATATPSPTVSATTAPIAPSPAPSTITPIPPMDTATGTTPVSSPAQPTGVSHPTETASVILTPSPSKQPAATATRTAVRSHLSLSARIVSPTIQQGKTEVVVVQTAPRVTLLVHVTTIRGGYLSQSHISARKATKSGQWRVLITVGPHTPPGLERVSLVARLGAQYAHKDVTFRVVQVPSATHIVVRNAAMRELMRSLMSAVSPCTTKVVALSSVVRPVEHGKSIASVRMRLAGDGRQLSNVCRRSSRLMATLRISVELHKYVSVSRMVNAFSRAIRDAYQLGQAIGAASRSHSAFSSASAIREIRSSMHAWTADEQNGELLLSRIRRDWHLKL